MICPPDGLEKEMTASVFPETSFSVTGFPRLLLIDCIRRSTNSRHCDADGE